MPATSIKELTILSHWATSSGHQFLEARQLGIRIVDLVKKASFNILGKKKLPSVAAQTQGVHMPQGVCTPSVWQVDYVDWPWGWQRGGGFLLWGPKKGKESPLSLF